MIVLFKSLELLSDQHKNLVASLVQLMPGYHSTIKIRVSSSKGKDWMFKKSDEFSGSAINV